MKVIFTFGGLPHYLINILNRLNRLPGYEVKVVVPSSKGKTLGKGVHESTDDIEFGVIRLEEARAWYGKVYFKKFTHILKQENPDILVINWPYVMAFLLIPSWRKSRKSRKYKLLYRDIPFNLPPYDQALEFYKNQLQDENGERVNKKWGLKQVVYYGLFRQLVRSYLKVMDAHLYYTEGASTIIPTYGVDPGKIFITYNTPDTDQLFHIREKIESDPSYKQIDRKIILHVGRLVAWKKVDLLIGAFSMVHRHYPESELWIIGDGPESVRLKNQAEQSGDGHSIKFLGPVYDPVELGKYHLQAAVYVLAGMGGLSINEAMAFGKPVICSRADGTEKKLVRHGYNGYFFMENDQADLADKIMDLLSNPEKIKIFGINSSNIIKTEINVHTVIDRYKKAFDSIAKNQDERNE